mmetsp:Transcript_49306/g.130667  ORF Transcript_49306/g.130667 Transcript_49306/m.130667 type:complete len:202 (-) Transcript_49306:265-870(-)
MSRSAVIEAWTSSLDSRLWSTSATTGPSAPSSSTVRLFKSPCTKMIVLSSAMLRSDAVAKILRKVLPKTCIEVPSGSFSGSSKAYLMSFIGKCAATKQIRRSPISKKLRPTKDFLGLGRSEPINVGSGMSPKSSPSSSCSKTLLFQATWASRLPIYFVANCWSSVANILLSPVSSWTIPVDPVIADSSPLAMYFPESMLTH